MTNLTLFATSTRRRVQGISAACSLAFCLVLVGADVQAQTPSSSPAAASAKPPPPAPSGLGVPPGQGAGVHGANSPIPQLPARSDVVPWPMLTDVKAKNEKSRMVPVFNTGQMALHQKTQRIQGFMMPLEPGAEQRRFLLSAVPLTCGFCLPGGPESMVEIRSKKPVKYSIDPVVVEGRFEVLLDDPYGMYYRVTDAQSVK